MLRSVKQPDNHARGNHRAAADLMVIKPYGLQNTMAVPECNAGLLPWCSGSKPSTRSCTHLAAEFAWPVLLTAADMTGDKSAQLPCKPHFI